MNNWQKFSTVILVVLAIATYGYADGTLTLPSLENANTWDANNTFTVGVTGNVTGDATGSSGSCTGQSATVATITGLAPDTATTQATQANITTCSNLTTVGALDAGTITSNFGAIDVGTSKIDGGVITADTNFAGALTGNVTGDCTGSSGSCTGNSGTATTATDMASKTGTGSTYATSVSPVFTTPNIGSATGDVSGSAGSCTGNSSTATTAASGDAAVDFFGAGVDAVTDATTCTDIEGTKLSITTSTLNVTETDDVVGAVTGAVYSNGSSVFSQASLTNLSDVAITAGATGEVTQFYGGEWVDRTQTAQYVNITDAGGYFEGTEVETALQEAGYNLVHITDNTAITPLTASPSVSGSALTITVTQPDAENLVFNINQVRLEHSSDVMTVNATAYAGTDAAPKTIYVYVDDNAGSPRLAASNTDPDSVSLDHVHIGTVKVGTVGVSSATIYGGFHTPLDSEEIISNTYHRFFNEGAHYNSGMDITAIQANVTIAAGSMEIIFDTLTTVEKVVGTDGMFVIDSAGDYSTQTDFAFTEYSTGESITADKYYNVVIGYVWSSAGSGKLMALVQAGDTIESGKEYKNVKEAIEDKYGTLVNRPSDTLLKHVFTPVCRIVILNNANDFLQEIPEVGTSIYSIDLRGEVGGGGGSVATSGAPTDADYWVGTANGDLSAEIVVNDSAGFAGAIDDESGTGLVVLQTNGTFVTPDLGTPSACVGTNISGTATSLTAGAVSTITGLAPDTATTQATQASITTCVNLVSVGALNSGTIAAGFGSINNGASEIVTTGTIGASGATMANGVIATTQSVADNSTKLATTAYADAAGLTWGDSLAGTTGDGLAMSVTANAAASLDIIDLDSNNTNSTFDVTGMNLVVEENAGSGTNQGIFIINNHIPYNWGATTTPAGTGLHIYQAGLQGTGLSVYGASNVNTSALVTFGVSDTQSGSSTVLRLDVGAANQAVEAIEVRGNSANTGAKAFHANMETGFAGDYIKCDLNSAEKFVVDNVGNIGVYGTSNLIGATTIGTAGSVPGNLSLHDAGVFTVYEDGNNFNVTFACNSGEAVGTLTGGLDITAALSATTITASTGFALGDTDWIGVPSNELLTFYTDGYANFSGCLVGIGTAAPEYALHIHGETETTSLVKSTVSSSYSMYAMGTDNASQASYLINYGSTHASADILAVKNTYGDIQFFPGTAGTATFAMTVENGGNVGIGTTAPAYHLDVFADVESWATNQLRQTSQTTLPRAVARIELRSEGDMAAGFGPSITFYGDDAGTTTKQFGSIAGVRGSADTEGEILFTAGTAGAEEFLRINEDGTIRIVSLTSADPLATDGDGDIIAGSSDVRLKSDIQDITYGMDTIAKLKPVSFQWREDSEMNDGGKQHLGFVAQEVEGIIPEAVGKRDQLGLKDCRTFDPKQIIPVLVKALQEHQKSNRDLLHRLQALEAKCK